MRDVIRDRAVVNQRIETRRDAAAHAENPSRRVPRDGALVDPDIASVDAAAQCLWAGNSIPSHGAVDDRDILPGDRSAMRIAT